MDTSETYIKMCEKAEEIQKEWQNRPEKYDYVFINTFKYYKRTLRGQVSHYELKDTARENPSWVEAHNNIRGIELVVHYIARGNHIKVDDSYPDSKWLVALETVRNRLLDEEYVPIEWIIWLPRQDQLQEMIGLPYNQEFLRLWQQFFSQKDYVLEEETGFEEPGWAEHTNSMEQLWLAFVMKEKYGKTWNGNKWVKV